MTRAPEAAALREWLAGEQLDVLLVNAGVSDNNAAVAEMDDAAVNQLMRSYAIRHAETLRSLLLLTPGWGQTDLGGPQAPLTVEQSAAGVVDTIEANHGVAGLRYVDYKNETLPWWVDPAPSRPPGCERSRRSTAGTLRHRSVGARAMR
jgi:hypothetical protein